MTPPPDRVLIVTRDRPRHRHFLALARRELGELWVATLLITDPPAAVPAPAPPPAQRGGVTARLRRMAVAARNRLLVPRRWIGPDTPLTAILARQCQPPAPPWEVILGCQDPLPEGEIPHLHRSRSPHDAETLAWLARQAPGVIVVWDAPILKGPWLTTARLGILNFHNAWLPFYRSSASRYIALYRGRLERVGGTVHRIDAGVDTGPLVQRVAAPLRQREQLDGLLARVDRLGLGALLGQARSALERGELPPGRVEHAPDSDYPARVHTPLFPLVAQWRLNDLSTPWPAYARRVASRRNRDTTDAGQVPSPGVALLLAAPGAILAQPRWPAALAAALAPASLDALGTLFRLGPPQRPHGLVLLHGGEEPQELIRAAAELTAAGVAAAWAGSAESPGAMWRAARDAGLARVAALPTGRNEPRESWERLVALRRAAGEGTVVAGPDALPEFALFTTLPGGEGAAWLAEDPERQAIIAVEGFNLLPSRGEWLAMALPQEPEGLPAALAAAALRARRALLPGPGAATLPRLLAEVIDPTISR